MPTVKKLFNITLLMIGGLISQVYAQPANLVLQDTTISGTSIFTAINSITAGPSFAIAGSGDVTFETAGCIYLRPGVVIIQGGRFQTITDSITVGITEPESPGIPAEFAMQQNYPNPFNPSTIIRYQLPVHSRVTLFVYDILGKEVARLVDEVQDAGYKSVRFNASGLPTGIYFYRLNASSFSATKKLMLVK